MLFIKTRNTHANYNMPNCFQITPIYIFCTINMLPPQIPCADWPYISPGQLHSARSRESLIYLLGLFDLKTSLVHRKNKHAKIDWSSLQDLLTFQEHLRSLVTTGSILLGSCVAQSLFVYVVIWDHFLSFFLLSLSRLSVLPQNTALCYPYRIFKLFFLF